MARRLIPAGVPGADTPTSRCPVAPAARAAMPLALALAACPAGADPAGPTGLELAFSAPVAAKAEGFTEPSGLAALPEGDGFWSVSDDAGALFRLSATGEVVGRIDLGKHAGGLEGLALDEARHRLLMVREDSSEILTLDPDDPATLDRFALERMAGYRAVAGLFRDPDNNGLEGIAVIPDTGTVVVVKESRPRLLLELTGDLATIRGALPLTAAMGFAVSGIPDRDLDVSGIAYDPTRKALWIASDTGRAVFLLDPAAMTATAFPLTWSEDGKIRPLDNAEGVALSADAGRLFVVTDDGHASRLAVYDIR